MSIAALIRSLSAAGATPEAIAIAVEAVEGAQAAVGARREADRERKRRQRERDASRDGHVTVTGQSADNADGPPIPDKEAPQTPKEINPTPGVITRTHEAEPDVPVLAKLTAAQIAIASLLAALAKRRWKDLTPPAGVTAEQWQGFLDHRRAKRETLTPRAHQLLLRKIERFADDEWPPGRIIDHIVERSWLSFEPEWLPRATDQRHGQRDRQNRGQGGRRAAHPGGRTGAAADRVFGGMAD